MKKLFLYPILIAFSLLFLSGCYTKLIIQEDYEKQDSTSVVVNTEVSYAGYGYRYFDNHYYGYQPYWYDGFYGSWYNPYRAYVIPFRPYRHYPYPIIVHKEEIKKRDNKTRNSGYQRSPSTIIRKNDNDNRLQQMMNQNLNRQEQLRATAPERIRSGQSTYSQPPVRTQPSAPANNQPANSGGNRNSGSTRSDRK